MPEISRFAAIYIVLITTAWCVLFFKYLTLKDSLKKNKNVYDLTNMRITFEPNDDGEKAGKMVIWIGKPKRIFDVTKADVSSVTIQKFMLDRIIQWLEEEKED